MPRKKKTDLTVSNTTNDKKKNKNIIETMNMENKENEHIILQLPISQTNINTITCDDDNNDPIPYEKEGYLYTDNNEILDNNNQYLYSNINENNNMINDIQSCDCNNNNNYEQNNESNKSCCFWCVHPIDYKIYSMPMNYDNFTNTYICYGSFCSLQCANAYNFSINSGSDKVWEVNSLIQMMGKLYNQDLPIRPAPSRYLLNIFNGGSLNINEYRELHKTPESSHILNLPPMINISSVYEVINTSYIKSIKNNLKNNQSKINNQLNKN
jgi:hypothetical protein